MLVDSHCHLNRLDLAPFENDLSNVIQQAQAHDVQFMLSVCVVLNDVPVLQAIAERFSNIAISVGVHPDETDETHEPDAQELVSLAQHPSCIAIGETGLDYYRTESEAAKAFQRTRFREHIRASRASSKPLIIHTRAAAEDTLVILREENAHEIGGVMHCFTEDWDVARRALDLNFYISFSGIVTFKNAQQLREVAQKVPQNRMLIETDSPYLAPVPFRGKQNHPALVKYVAQAMAELRGVNEASIAAQTTKNFYDCFRLHPK